MKCPFCGKNDSGVLESRVVDDGQSVRRRRRCRSCKRRFTTYERTRASVLWVVKKDGKREPFEKEKIKRGILRAIEKRPVSLEQVDEIVEAVEREMLRSDKEEVTTRAIGQSVLKRLKKLDKIAWLRFASVYLEFEDLKDFEKAMRK